VGRQIQITTSPKGTPRHFGSFFNLQTQLVIKKFWGERFNMGLSFQLGAPIQSGQIFPNKFSKFYGSF
jgi:hypothetical protein